MPNPYVNKVVQSNGTTLIDISDTTAVAADVASGKYFYLATGEKVAGTKAEKTLVQKSITLNGTYDPDDDNADGYSEVTVNVQGGASMTEVENTYGTELVITSAPGSAPSATRHTLYFEFEDETTETEYAYYDDSFISSAITATTPTTRNNKTVTSAQLDGTEWYSYTPTPSGNYETIFDGTATANNGQVIITSLADYYFAENETYRVTVDGATYICTTAINNDVVTLGNFALYSDISAEGDYPFLFFNIGWGGVYGYIQNGGNTSHTIKLEKQVSA